MKQAIVLLVSLFFIMMLSVLMLNNLEKSDELLDNSNRDFANMQALILTKNYQKQVGNLLIKHKEDFHTIFTEEFLSQTIPVNINNIETKIHITKINEAYNINDLFESGENKRKRLEEYLLNNSVDVEGFKYFATNYLKTIQKDLKHFENKKQLRHVIDAYILDSSLTQMNSIENKLTLFNATEQNKFIACMVEFSINNRIYNSSFIYDVDTLVKNDIKVSEFEFNFK